MDTNRAISEALARLSDTEKDSLMTTFDNLIPHFITLADNRFVGTHVKDDPRLIIEHTNGFWFVGRIKPRDPQ